MANFQSLPFEIRYDILELLLVKNDPRNQPPNHDYYEFVFDGAISGVNKELREEAMILFWPDNIYHYHVRWNRTEEKHIRELSRFDPPPALRIVHIHEQYGINCGPPINARGIFLPSEGCCRGRTVSSLSCKRFTPVSVTI